MKKLIILCTLLCFAISAPAMAELKSMMMVGPYAGYTLGFGDRFQDVEESFGGFSASASSDAGFSFGGSFFYGITEKLMLGGELMVQQYKFEVESDLGGFDFPKGNSPSDYFMNKISGIDAAQQSVSDSEMKISFLASFLYAFSYMESAMLMGNFGAGLYDHGTSDIGIFGGLMYQRLLSETMSLFVLPRVHYVFSDLSMIMVQVVVGLHFWLGQTGAPMSK